MKRILAVLMTCLILVSTLNIGTFAFTSEVGNINVSKLGCDDVITVDGSIDTENEFWSNTTAINLNDNNTATAWNYRSRVITDTDIRFAYSNEGLYVAAKTNDDTPIRSTGHEMHPITGEDDNEFTVGWNGDTLILAFDPLQTMTNSYTEWADYSQKCPAWYCFTIMDDGTTGIWRGKAYKLDENDEPVYNETGDVSDVVSAVAASTVDGQWDLEVFIPWTELAYTLGLITDGNYVIDAEEFAKSGAIHNAKFIYMNRYAYDQKDGTGYSGMFLGSPDTGTIVTICRNFTVCNMIPGTSYQGIQGNPEQARTSGMYLNLVDATDDDALHTPAAEPEIIDATCTEVGKSTIYCTKCREILSREYLPLADHDYYVSDASTGKQKCSVCDGTAGAIVNGTDPYETFSKAYAAANAGDSIKLFGSETMPSTLALDKDMTIDLGGKTVKSDNGPIFEISANIVFNNSTGTGKVSGNGVDIPVKIVGGTTTINKGRFSGDGIAIFDIADGAELIINGGQIRSVAEGLTSHFVGNGSIVIYGGTFRGADPTMYLAPCLSANGVYDEADNYTEYSIIAEHNVGEIEEKAPTCTEDGFRKSSCVDCGRPAVDEVIPALGHIAGETEELLPTCTEDGYRKAICTVCGEFAINEIIPATGHTEGEEQTVEVSCTEDGAVYTVCTVCGEIVSYEVVAPATGHSYNMQVKEATCAEDGLHSFVCVCGDTHTYIIPALDHTFGEWNVLAEATCDTPGSQERICSVCGAVEVEEIAPLAHVEVHVDAVDVTCFDNGNVEYYYCSVCGAHWTPDGMPTNAKRVILPANGEHTWGDWVTVNKPTLTEEGEKVRECVICAETESAVIDVLPEETTPQIVVSDVEGFAGDTVTLTVDIKNNPGFAGMNAYLEYSDVLVLGEVTNSTSLDFTSAVTMVWDAPTDYTEDGELIKITFDIPESAEAGEYYVKLNFIEAYNAGFEAVDFVTVEGSVIVKDCAYGDVNGDGEINTKDIILLRQYIAARDPITGECEVEIAAGADANGDGVINTKDIILMRQYIAARDPITGESDVVLGPMA